MNSTYWAPFAAHNTRTVQVKLYTLYWAPFAAHNTRTVQVKRCSNLMQFDPINPGFISLNCSGTADGADD